MIKSTAVDLPFFAMGPFWQIIGFAQTQIQSDKIKRCADPSHRGNHMNPSNGKCQPVPNNGKLLHALFSHFPLFILV